MSHASCPENKNFVRGEVKVGGYVIRDNPDNPQHSAIVTYVTQVDLKGGRGSKHRGWGSKHKSGVDLKYSNLATKDFSQVLSFY